MLAILTLVAYELNPPTLKAKKNYKIQHIYSKSHNHSFIQTRKRLLEQYY